MLSENAVPDLYLKEYPGMQTRCGVFTDRVVHVLSQKRVVCCGANGDSSSGLKNMLSGSDLPELVSMI